jgi:opacity protein-like surface antigen
MKKTIVSAIVCAFCIQTVSAADWSTRFQYDTAGPKFNANELQVDLFGLYASRDREHYRSDTLGFGVGANYFFTRHFGVGAETYVDDVHWPRHVDGSFFARYPIEQLSLAPYALAGVGRQFHDVAQWTAHIGLGLDFRLNRATGIFLDVRQVYADRSRDFSLWRAGVRLAF